MLHGAKPIATCDAMEFLAMYEPLQGDAKSSTHTVVVGIFDFFDPPCTKQNDLIALLLLGPIEKVCIWGQ